MSGKSYSRRSVAIGGGIAVALGLTALGLSTRRLLPYAKTPYDDLLQKLIDRDAGATVGQAIIGTATLDSREIAADLRTRLKDRTLADVTKEDIAQDRLIEAKGWVLPQTVGLLCVLAAQPL